MSFFGGGWISGAPERGIAWAKWAAEFGMVGIAPDYRTRDRLGGQPGILFAGLAFGAKPYFDFWQKFPTDPADPEIQRNIAITQPLIWLEER